ncbi:MAG TPA: hypothetical protein VLQ93_21430 [Myxococcaceae bacterium]|nr:hypothetical protein [Myxococcaceae bacterium]
MRKKIGELLIESGVVTEEQVRKALGQQRAFGHGQRLGSVLVHLGHASRAAVSRALARQCNLPFLELPEIPPEVSKIVSLDFQAEHRVVSFRLEKEGRSERLSVAVEDPTDLSVVDALRFQLNKPIRVFVAAPDDIDRALELARGDGELDVVEAISLDEDDGLELEIDHGSAGLATPPPPPVDAVLLDWELPPALEDDSDVTPPTPRSTLKPSVPPPAPPPDLDDEDGGDITLITPLSALTPKPTAAPVRPPPPPVQESEELLEELLGEPEPEPAAAASGKPRVPVVVFGGAAQGLPQPPPPPEPPAISEDDLTVLADIERLAAGGEAVLDTEKVKPARMVASLIRHLLRKRIIREEEFLEELSRK